jgi:hypothetical protein
MSRPRPEPNVVVTGIPRSGVNYLCGVLNQFDNAVAIADHPRVAHILRDAGPPWGIATLYRKLRADVADRRAITGHLPGRDRRWSIRAGAASYAEPPPVRDDGFVLALANHAEFLARLRDLKRVLPGARVLACVRNPLDAIASWMGSLAVLHNADVLSVTIGHPEDPNLTEGDRARLREIAGIRAIEERRARWWLFFAERVLEEIEGEDLVVYEDLVTRPQDYVAGALRGLSAGDLRQPVAPSEARSHRERLTPRDYEAILDICSPAAEALGVSPVL